MDEKLEERRAAVEKIAAFRKSLGQTCELFMDAARAVRTADDCASEADAEIADAIDKHLQAVALLCDYGNELGAAVGEPQGFGSEHRAPDGWDD